MGRSRSVATGSLPHRQQLVDMVAGLLGSPGVAVIEGVRGSGRTAVLDAVLRRRPAGSTVLRARGFQDESSLAHGLITRLFADLGPEISGDARDWMTQTVRRLAADSAVVIAIDDLDLADAESARWCAYLARRLGGSPVTLLVTTLPPAPDRPDQTADLRSLDATQVVSLPALCDSCVIELADRWLDAPLGEDLSALVSTLAQGRPGIVSVLVERLLAAGVDLERPDPAVVAGVAAATVAETSVAWTAALSPAAMDMLAAMVVLGNNHGPAAVAQLAGVDGRTAAAARVVLREAGLVTQDHLAHDLVGPAVTRWLGTSGRAELHRRAAELTSRLGAPSGEIAAHLLALPAEDRGDVSLVLLHAAREAAGDRDWDTAASYLRSALAEPSADRDQITAELAVIDSHRDLPAVTRMVAAAAARPLTPAWHRALRTFADRGVALVDDTIASAIRSLAGLSKTTSTPSDRGSVGIGSRLTGDQRRLVAAAALLGQGDAARTVLRNSPEPGLLRGGVELATARAFGWAFAGRRRLSAERVVAEVLASRAPLDGATLLTATLTAVWCEQFVAASRLADQAVDAFCVADSPVGHALALLARAELRRRMVKPEATCVDAESAAKVAAEVGAGVVVNAASAIAALARLDAGDPNAAAQLLSTTYGPVGPTFLATPALLAHGRLALERGDADQAAAWLGRCGQLLEQVGAHNPAVLDWRDHLVSALVLRDGCAAARPVAQEQLRAALSWGAPGSLTQSHRSLARTLSEAPELIEAVHAQAQVLSPPSPRPENAAQAVPELPQAEPVDLRVGSRPLRLTDGERRVIDLVLQGMSNQAVADILFLSKRTVDTHLGRVYRKLSIAGRPDLAEAVRSLS